MTEPASNRTQMQRVECFRLRGERVGGMYVVYTMRTTDVPIQAGVGWVWDGKSARIVSCMRDMSAQKSRT